MIELPREAIHNLHGCDSTWIASASVKQVFEGETVWEGVVEVFDLQAHPTANKAYAWSHLVDGSERRRFVAVLHEACGLTGSCCEGSYRSGTTIR